MVEGIFERKHGRTCLSAFAEFFHRVNSRIFSTVNRLFHRGGVFHRRENLFHRGLFSIACGKPQKKYET